MLTRIELKNFKAFQTADVKLSGLNLFTGVNGLGKSTVIQALLLLRQSYFKGLFPNNGILLNGELINIGKGSDVLNIHSESKEINFIVTCDDVYRLNVSMDYKQDNDFLPLIPDLTSIHQNVFKEPLFNDTFKYLSAERISPKSSYSVSLFEVEQNKSLGIHGEHTSLFISRYQRESVKLEYALHKEADSDRLIDQVSAWLSEIAPGVSIKSRYFPEIDAARFSYQFEYEKTFTPEFSPMNVGFGLTYALPVITSILASKPGDLIIIENPESHLHPAGQSKLGELMFRAALSNVQIILETHSDHVLNGIRVAVRRHRAKSELVKIFFLQRDSGSKKHLTKIVTPRLDNNGQIDDWPDDFFDQSVKDLNFLMGL